MGHNSVPVNRFVFFPVMLAIVYLLAPSAARADCSPDGSTCSFDLWATQVQEEGNAWTNKSLAVGSPSPEGCSATCGDNTAAQSATAGNTTRLVATSFNHFDLPIGHRVSLVRANALVRYNNNVAGQARLSVVVPGFDTYAPECSPVTSLNNQCLCSNSASDITDIFPFKQNPDLINQTSLRVRRCGSADPANLRVDAFRIHVETERIPCPCAAHLRGNGFCNCVCNRAECNFDDGDCSDPCYQQGCCDDLLGDGACNPQCNIAACGYDDNDCCEGQNFCDAASFDIPTLYETVHGFSYDSSALTIETWIHLDEFNTDHGEPLRYVGNNGSPWQFQVLDAKNLRADLLFTVGSSSAVAREVLSRSLDARWYHIAGSYDGATIRLYVDGQLVASTSQSAGIPTAGADPRLVLSLKMKCQMDEIRIWKVARSQDQIRCYMTQPVPSPLWSLMFDYWDCTPLDCKFCPGYPSLIAPQRKFFYAQPVTSGANYNIPTTFTVQIPIADIYVCEGQPTSMNVTSVLVPLRWYQWYRDGNLMPDDPYGVRTMAPVLFVPNAQISDSGTYECVVSNGCYQATATRHLHVTNYADCMTGPIGDVPDACGCDRDGDGDVDLKDYAAFQIDFGAPQ